MITNSLEEINSIEKDRLFVIKIGGNVIDEEKNLHSFLKDFSSIKEKKILVHGGGKIATAIGDKLNIKSKYIDGRRITDDETIDLVTMVYGGLVNKRIVAVLQSLQCNAIGLTGADCNLIPATKRGVKALYIGDILGEPVDYGWVGDVDAASINTSTWQLFIDNNLVPAVASLTHDEEGHILNTNADTMASALSIALSKLYNVYLIYCFEKNGVLTNADDETTVITGLNVYTYNQLKDDKKLFAGILPKIDNAFDAINNGVQNVLIGNSNELIELVHGRNGTKIIS